MTGILKKITAYAMIAALTMTVFSGCAVQKEETAKKAVVDTIYIGTHYQPEDDPYYVDQVTGENPSMNPDKIKAATAALATVKEQLGVDIKWKQWPNGVTQDCLQTVLAGDPYCHIAILSNGFQGRVMIQNVLQPLDKYMDIFEEEDAQWIVTGKTFDHHYLLNRDLLYITDWPMVYNATMLEQIPALKEEDGTTLYPVELYERGQWTWSVFEDYLSKIQAYYANKTASNGKAIVPYDARYQYTAIQAIHSNGAYLYNGSPEMKFDSPEAIEACEYLDSLMTKGLVNCIQSKFGSSRDPGYLQSVDCFANGQTVFTNCARWKMSSSSSKLAERGESMGIIFFPRPDDVDFKEYNNEVHNSDYQYKIAISCADSVGLLRGFNEEESRLALEAYKLYKIEFYKNYGGVDSIKEYRETMCPTEAISFGVDIFHPEIGEKNLEIFQLLGSLSENEYGEAMNIIWSWGVDIFGASVYANDGSPKYAVKVAQSAENLRKKIDDIAEALNKGDKAVDSVAPSISAKTPIVFHMGQDPSEINWPDIFSGSDNVDGEYEIKMENGKILVKANPNTEDDDEDDKEKEKKVYEFEEGKMQVIYTEIVDEETGEVTKPAVDFNKAGTYEKALLVTLKDSSDQEAKSYYTVYVIDDESTQKPTLELKAEEDFGKVYLEDDIYVANYWYDRFVSSATDVNGIDLKSRVKADLTEIDITMEGTYPVRIYVEDFAGNIAEQTITITVKKK